MATTTQTVQLMLVSTVKGAQVLTPVQLQLKGISSAANAAIPPVTKLHDRLNSFGNVISKSISNIRGTLVGLGTAMAIIGTVQMFRNTIAEAIEFEKQMANVSTILQGTDVSLDQLKRGLIDLDGSLGSSSEQAKALYQALSTGVPAAKSIDFVATSARFAKANLADLDATTRLLATTMNAFGDRISSVEHLADVFSETIRVGVITGEELVASLGTVISTAALAGVSIEEVAAAIATLTSVGIPAQQATTGLNQAMLAFIDAPPKAAKAAKDLGVELSALRLRELGLVGAMQEVNKLAGSNVESLQSLFTETRAFRAAAALTGEQLEFFAESATKMKVGIDGLTVSMHQLQQQSLSAQFETAVNNINKSFNFLWQTLIDKLTPAIVETSEKLIEFARAIERGDYDGTIEQLGNIAEGFLSIADMITKTIVELNKLGTFGRILDQILRPLENLMELFSPAMSENVKTFAERLDMIVTVLINISNFIAPVEKLIQLLALGKAISLGAWEDYDKVLREMKGSMTTLLPVTAKLDAGISGVSKGLQSASAGLEGSAKLTDLFSEVIDTSLDPSIKNLNTGLGEVDKKTQNLIDSFKDAINPSAALAKKITELSSLGFTESEIMRGLYDEIIKVAEAERLMERTIHPVIAAKLEKAQAIQKVVDALKQEIEFEKMLAEGAGPSPFDISLTHPLQFFLEQQEKFLEGIKESKEAFSNALENWQREMDDLEKEEKAQLTRRLENYAKFFGILSGLIGGFSGKFFDVLANGFAAAADVAKDMEEGITGAFGNVLTSANKFAAFLGGAMAALAQHMEGTSKKIVSSIAALAMGFAQGNWLGLAIAGVGVLISLFSDLDNKIRKATNAARAFGFEISEALAEEILATAEKQVISLEKAVLASLDKILAETGVTAENLNFVIYSFDRAFATFVAGSDLAKKVIQDLNGVFPQMLEAGTDSFGRLNNQVLGFIQRLRDAGIEMESLTNFLKGEFQKAASSLESLIAKFAERVSKLEFDFDNLTKFDTLKLNEVKSEFEDFFNLVIAQFNRMKEEGFSLAEIFEMIGPSIEKLRDAAIDLGLQGTPALRALNQMFKMMKSEAAQDLGEINNLLVAFHNLGILNQQTFSSLEDIFNKVYKQFNKDGKISKIEMQAMLPTLAQLRYMSERYGFTLDRTTQKLINQAIAQGKLSEEVPIDPMDRLSDVIEDKLVPAIDKLNTGFATMMGWINTIDGSTIDITTNYSENGAMPVPKPHTNTNGGSGYYSLQSIDKPFVKTVTRHQEVFVAHKGETAIITPSPEQSREKVGNTVVNLPIRIIPISTTQVHDEVVSVAINQGSPLVTQRGRRG